jgi:sigma-B regulation protein RsbU (phosphoserine phosphatase)
MKQARKRMLSEKFLISLIILTLVICLSVSTLVTILYYKNQIREYGATAFALARTTADTIDGDRIQGYLDTLEKDDYYDEVQAVLERNKREFNLLYHYVFALVGDEAICLWDAETGDSFGYKEEDVTASDLQEGHKVLSGEAPQELYVNYSPQYGLCGTAWVPLYDSAGRGVAVVGVDYSMPRIHRMILMFAVVVTAGVVTVTALGGFLYYRSIKKNIIRPIELLNHASGEMVNNIEKDVAFNVDIHTGDELEALADSFGKMDRGLRKYIRELARVTAEKERIGAELNVATQIQADMLPRIFPAFPNRRDIEIHASMIPAKEVGGDFYDFFLVDDDHLALVMADVSGKGVPAALFMVIAKTLIKNRLMAGDSPAQALSNVNEQLCEGNEAKLFVTVWAAVIELSTGRGVAANAGHEHPALRRAGGVYELVIYRHSPIVAAIEGMRFREHEFQLNPGDSLFVYTDGVAEATNAQNELFGAERTLAALNRDPDAEPKTILTNVMDGIDAFVADAEQFDDITMLCFRYNGPEK